MGGVQPSRPAHEWMAEQLAAAKKDSSGRLSGTVADTGRPVHAEDDGRADRPPASPSVSQGASWPHSEDGLPTSFYTAMQVHAKDPLSKSSPLRAFDRTLFESTFPQTVISSASFASDLARSSSGGNSINSFPPSSNSSSSSTASSISIRASTPQTLDGSIPASTPSTLDEPSNDPFFYPLLCANERRRLSEFWYLTSGIHDDRELAVHLQSLLTIVKDLYDFDTAVIQLIDNDRSSSIDMNGWQETCCPRRETACAHTMLLQPGTVLSVTDFLSDSRFSNNRRLVDGQVRSYAGAPLAYTVDGSGEVVSLGSLCVFSFVNQKPPLTAVQRESLCRFADLAIHAIKDRSRLRREHIQIRRNEILTQVASTAGPPSRIVEVTLKALQSTLGGRASFIECRDGCIDLYNVGRVAFTQFQGGLWENIAAIEDFIRYHNHEPSLNYDPECTIRAIAVPLSNVNHHYLVVETGRLRDIYNGTDVLFVQSCAMVIASSIQDGLLRQALEAKTSFLRNAQHAFRTSLNGILSATDMLLGEDYPLNRNGDVARYPATGVKAENITPLDLLRIIETSGRGLLTVINHLIDLDAQKVSANLELCDLHEIEEEVLDSVVQKSSKEKMKDLLLVSDSQLDDSTGDCIMTDKLLLRQIVSALVYNAVEATSGSSMVTIKFSLTGQFGVDQALIVEVADTGVGIAKTDHERIFQAFEKVDSYTPNAGLGLTFACQYAATLGGNISLVHSTPSAGSVFRFSLPHPILASSLQMHKLRDRLSKNWSYWTQNRAHDSGSQSHHCTALERLGVTLASSPLQASMLVQVDNGQACELLPPPSNQILLALGWEEDHLARRVSNVNNHRVVYGRLPFTRNRLIAALLRAQKLALRLEQVGTPATPVEELTNLQLPVTGETNIVRALLVDDNAMNLSILQAYCKKRRYEYQSASDGKEAFRIYVAACEAGFPPTICLLDLQMPVCDGIGCASMIRTYERQTNRSRCPIVMVTAQSSDGDRKEAIEAGTDAYYVKPLRVSTLDDIIARYTRT